MTRCKTLSTRIALAASALAFIGPAFAQGTSPGMSQGTGMAASGAASGMGAGMASGMAGSASSAVKSGDRRFVMEAAKGGMKEVALGQVAQQKGSSDAVKQFGQRMVDDHTKANNELMQLASSKGITPPASMPKDAKMAKLEGMNGAAFDRAYMAEMLADHKKTIALFEKQSRSGSDADLKAFATKTLPTLQAHLQMLQADGSGGTMKH